jgi:hypothetical protein
MQRKRANSAAWTVLPGTYPRHEGLVDQFREPAFWIYSFGPSATIGLDIVFLKVILLSSFGPVGSPSNSSTSTL